MWNNSYKEDTLQNVTERVLKEVQGSSLHMQLQKAAQVSLILCKEIDVGGVDFVVIAHM